MTVARISPRAKACDLVQACVVLPVYNNARTVGAVVQGALEHATTVLVCDDGSTDGSGDAARSAGASVLRNTENYGKGVALRRLLEEARTQGFRYAISMDADGQHSPEDLATIARAARESPGALIVGIRDLVEAGAPPSSEFGRKFCNFWVWLESGVRVPDSQSGFRAYPLPEVPDCKPRGTRYEFECDILLRAGWAGIPVKSVPIRVSYPADRVTHFRLVLDNVRIVTLNTLTCLRLLQPLPLGPRLARLPHRPGFSLFQLRRWAWLGGEGPLWRLMAAMAGVLWSLSPVGSWNRVLVCAGAVVGGLGALPALAAAGALGALRRQGIQPRLAAAAVFAAFALLGAGEALLLRRKRGARHWTGRSRGGVFGHWFFYRVTETFGVTFAYWVIYPIALYFFFASRSARRASLEFLEHAVGPVPLLPRLRRSYCHIVSFARTLVDRALFAVRGKDAFRYEATGIEHIQAAAASGRGVILLTAHVGNWPIAASLMGEAGEKLAVVAYPGEHERVGRYLEKVLGPGPRVIPVGSEVLASLEMVRALREGTVLALQGDRPIDRHVVRVPFLGRDAPFPVGPFILAAVSGAPLIFTFSLQVGPASYRFFAKPPLELGFRPGANRDSQLRAWVQQYVSEVEAVARQYPYQWFNFYDFWDAAPPIRLAPALA